MQIFHKKNLPIPAKAERIHQEIVVLLENLLALDVSSPCHPDFISLYKKVLLLFKTYQDEVIKGYHKSITCSKDCTYCCYHWVEDVHSFEAEIITEYIRIHFPQKIEMITEMFLEDEKHLIIVNDIMEEKLAEKQHEPESAGIDTTDLLLASFYQLNRPCAFLSEDKTCLIYEVRPLTCRIYISFSDPQHCSPKYINRSNIPTYHLDLEENASQLLDTLHERYNRFDKTGLRAVLVDCLKPKIRS